MGTGRPGRSKLEEAVWIALLERYVAGEVARELADEHGVSVEAVFWQARNRGYRKRDRPGAVYRWSRPPPITPAPDPVVARGFAFDPLDLEGSEARALDSARRAADEGRLPDFLALTQSARAVRRLRVGMFPGGYRPSGYLSPQTPGGAEPLAGRSHAIACAPPNGEGEGWCEPVLRAAQREPAGDWTTWLFLGGRGAGKTLAGATLALLRMGLRLGERPRLVVTTTPRPIGALRDLRAEPGLVETHAATRDNAENLSAGFVEGLERLYGGTRKAAQELEGRVVDIEGALFTAAMLAGTRGVPEGASFPRGDRPSDDLSPQTPEFDRIVVAIDPTTTAGGNACGIVVAGRSRVRGNDDVATAHVLADRSVAGLGPDGWARRAVRAAEEFGAVALVVEVNQGGEMVRAVLKTAGCSVRIREVRATKGKRIRAEPVAALYEQGRVTHAPGLRALEEELMAIGAEEGGAGDLDRADALVWALTDLLIDRSGGEGPRIRVLDWPAGRPGLAAC